MVQAIQLYFKKSRETKFIYHCDSGFEVRVQRSGIVYRKNFSNRRFGGQALSMKAAVAWRDELLMQVGPPLARPYCFRKNKRNKSGKVGVGFIKKIREGGEEITGVIARWRDVSGKYISKSFSVRKMGFEKAFSIATQLREIKEMELSCYHQMDHMILHEQIVRFQN